MSTITESLQQPSDQRTVSCSHTRGQCLALGREILTHGTAWMTLEDIHMCDLAWTLSNSQRQRGGCQQLEAGIEGTESVLGHRKGSERSYKQIKTQFEAGLCDADCH